MCVVQLPGTCQLPVPPYRGVESPEVGERGGKGESVQHLRDTGSCLVSLALVSPVPSGQRVLETISDGAGLNGQLKVEVLK